MSKRDLPYIEDPIEYKAVMFARKLKKEMPIQVAIVKASRYYKIDHSIIARHFQAMGTNIRKATTKLKKALISFASIVESERREGIQTESRVREKGSKGRGRGRSKNWYIPRVKPREQEESEQCDE